MTVEYVIRPGRGDSADFAAISRLEESCAQGTDIKYFYQNERPRTEKYDDTVTLMAEIRETGYVVGCFSANFRRVQFREGCFENVSWVFGLRIDPGHRRGGLALRLIQSLEEVLVKRGVRFAYAGTWRDNVPSYKLFEKAGYAHMLSVPLQGVNVADVYPRLAREKLEDGISTEKLDKQKSAEFLQQNFANSFYFPNLHDNPIDCRIYRATKKSTGDFAAFALAQIPDEWNFVEVSLKFRLYCLLLTILNFFLPWWFEKPLPLGHRWLIFWAMPFCYSSTDDKTKKALFKSAMASCVRDMYGRADVIAMSLTKSMGNIAQEDEKLAQQSLYLSKTVLHDAGARWLGRCLQQPETFKSAQELEQFAAKQPFWFVDAKEI